MVSQLKYAILASNFNVIVLLRANFTCFVLGPYQWKLCLLDNKGYSLKENIVKHNISEAKHSVQFSSLEYAKEYKVCVAVTGKSQNQNCNAALQKESRFTCRDIRTECILLPNANKIPIKVDWDPKEELDPFTSIKIMMESGTFDGAKSGLSKFSIR
jgi:hypothetical protein